MGVDGRLDELRVRRSEGQRGVDERSWIRVSGGVGGVEGRWTWRR